MQVIPNSSAAVDQTLNPQFNTGNTLLPLSPDKFAFTSNTNFNNSPQPPSQSGTNKLEELRMRNNINPNIQTLNQYNNANGASLVPLAGYLPNQANPLLNFNPNTELITDNFPQSPQSVDNLNLPIGTEFQPFTSYLPIESSQLNPTQSNYNSASDPFNYQQQASATTLQPGFFPPGSPEFNKAVFGSQAGTLDLTRGAETFANPIAKSESSSKLPRVNSGIPGQLTNTPSVNARNATQPKVVKLNDSKTTEVEQNIKAESTEKRVNQIFKKFIPGGMRMKEEALAKLRKESRKHNS